MENHIKSHETAGNPIPAAGAATGVQAMEELMRISRSARARAQDGRRF